MLIKSYYVGYYLPSSSSIVTVAWLILPMVTLLVFMDASTIVRVKLSFASKMLSSCIAISNTVLTSVAGIVTLYGPLLLKSCPTCNN